MKYPSNLATAALSATTLTDVYTSPQQPAATGLETITVCNRGGTDTTFRMAISPKGATIADAHYVYYDVAVPANDTILLNGSFNL